MLYFLFIFPIYKNAKIYLDIFVYQTSDFVEICEMSSAISYYIRFSVQIFVLHAQFLNTFYSLPLRLHSLHEPKSVNQEALQLACPQIPASGPHSPLNAALGGHGRRGWEMLG